MEDNETKAPVLYPSDTRSGLFVTGGLIGLSILASTALAVHKFAPEPEVIEHQVYLTPNEMADYVDLANACRLGDPAWFEKYMKTKNPNGTSKSNCVFTNGGWGCTTNGEGGVVFSDDLDTPEPPHATPHNPSPEK
jgi:hypothetical protein